MAQFPRSEDEIKSLAQNIITGLTDNAAMYPAPFSGTMGLSDFPPSFIAAVLSFLAARTTPTRRGQRRDLPGSARDAWIRAWGLRPRGVRVRLAIPAHAILPSVLGNAVGTPNTITFAAQYPAHTFPCQRLPQPLSGKQP